jgi:alkylation response protein AidB-like acyl-CoA dehydrogenase
MGCAALPGGKLQPRLRGMENPYAPTHPEIRDAIRQLCLKFDGAYWRELDRERGYPTAFVKALTEAGWLATLIPEEYGGAGLGISAAAAVLEEVQRAGCNGAACHAQMYTMGTVLRHGSAEQKKRYLPGIASGQLRLQAFGVTEPSSGTDTLALRTTAVKKNNSTYLVNGQKVWTSRAEHSDLMLLLARTTPKEQTKKRTEGLSVFLVDMRQALGHGLTIRPIRTMMNHNSTEVFFDNMEVPAENLIGEEGQGFRYILGGMNAERILIAAECIGDARWFIEKATDYAKERKLFGRAIGQNQGVQFPIARCYAQTEAADLMVRKAAALYEAGLPCGAEANMAKMIASEAAWAAADMCVQTHGGFGFAEEYDIERKFRETRLYMVAPISTNMILNFVAEHVLGLPRSY